MEKARCYQRMTRAEARAQVQAKWREGYRALAAAAYPEVRFATPKIAEAIGLIESLAGPRRTA